MLAPMAGTRDANSRQPGKYSGGGRNAGLRLGGGQGICTGAVDAHVGGRFVIDIFGQIEPVHRAAQIQIAVGIEEAHEAARVAFQIAFHLEFQAERIIFRLLGIQPHAAEAAVPFQRGA